MCTYTYLSLHMYIMYMYPCKHMCMCMYRHGICTYTCVYLCICTCMYMCLPHVCMQMYIHGCMHLCIGYLYEHVYTCAVSSFLCIRCFISCFVFRSFNCRISMSSFCLGFRIRLWSRFCALNVDVVVSMLSLAPESSPRGCHWTVTK